MSEHAHKRHQQLKKKEGNSCLGMLIKGTRDWKIKRGVKHAQNMSTIEKTTTIFCSTIFFKLDLLKYNFCPHIGLDLNHLPLLWHKTRISL